MGCDGGTASDINGHRSRAGASLRLRQRLTGALSALPLTALLLSIGACDFNAVPDDSNADTSVASRYPTSQRVWKKEKSFFETRVTEYQTGGALSWD